MSEPILNKQPAFIKITTPLNDRDIRRLKAGDRVLISGRIYTARDTAHRRLIELLEKGEKLPFNIEGEILYYTGPAPAPPGRVIGSAGPTTSGRMDIYSPALLKIGLKAMIGKGMRSEEVKRAMIEYKAVYFGATGGAGALLSQKILKSRVIAYPELGAEAVRCLEVKDFPVVVINDIYGGDLYQQGIEKYSR